MTRVSQTPTKRRWFRFSLRTLLIVVALAAVGSWAYWIGWPWWKIHREQQEFESALSVLHAGINRSDIGMLPLVRSRHFVMGSTWYDLEDGSNGDASYWFEFDWPNCTYLVCFKYSSHAPGHEGTEYCVAVQAFKLPIPDTNDRPVSPRVREYLRVNKTATPRNAQILDVLDLTSTGRTTSPGVKYQLIYSDPPQNDKPQ